MQLSNKLIRCNWDGEHSFKSSAAGTGLVRHVCEHCHAVSFDSVDYLSTRAMSLKTSTLQSLINRYQTSAAA